MNSLAQGRINLLLVRWSGKSYPHFDIGRFPWCAQYSGPDPRRHAPAI